MRGISQPIRVIKGGGENISQAWLVSSHSSRDLERQPRDSGRDRQERHAGSPDAAGSNGLPRRRRRSRQDRHQHRPCDQRADGDSGPRIPVQPAQPRPTFDQLDLAAPEGQRQQPEQQHQQPGATPANRTTPFDGRRSPPHCLEPSPRIDHRRRNHRAVRDVPRRGLQIVRRGQAVALQALGVGVEDDDALQVGADGPGRRTP